MESYYLPSEYVLFDDISFSLGTVPMGKMNVPVAMFRRQSTIVACRIICPDSQLDPKAWLVERLRLALEDKLEACHSEPVCRECIRSLGNIHAQLSNWLSPEQHRKFLEEIGKRRSP